MTTIRPNQPVRYLGRDYIVFLRRPEPGNVSGWAYMADVPVAELEGAGE